MDTVEQAADGRPIAAFRGWIWDPHTTTRIRGLATADLFVFPALLRVLPRPIGTRLGRLRPVDYQWPAVVLEYINWTWRWNWPGIPTVLLDIDGALGSVAVSRGSRTRLLDALNAAGFRVEQVKQRGWEQPAPVAEADFGELSGSLPPSAFASNRWTTPARRVL